MKTRINWKRILMFIAVCGGLLYITESAIMSAGVLLLLFVADYLTADYIKKKNNQDKQ